MNLQQLVHNFDPSYNIERTNYTRSIRNILFSNPELLTQLDLEASSKLLREVLFVNNDCDLETIKIFLKHKSNLSVLQIALALGNVKLVEEILQKGEKPEGPEWYMRSLVNCIFWLENIDVCKDLLVLLIKYGFDANFHNSDGENLIHMFFTFFACRYYYKDVIEITKVLISSGVSVTEVDNHGWTPFVRSMRVTNNVTVVSFLIEQGALVNFNYDSVKIDEQYPIIAAYNDENTIALLLSCGVDINFKTHTGWTVLHEACEDFGNEESVKFLMTNGADINAEDDNGESPLTILGYSFGSDYDANISITMIKELSKLIFEDFPLSTLNKNVLQENLKIRMKFELCTAELKKMSTTIFYYPYSYYFVLRASKNNVKKLAILTKNEEFITNFGAKTHEFPIYQIDLKRIFMEAIQVRDESLVVESRLKSIFADFFPDLVLRKLAENLTPGDLPLTI